MANNQPTTITPFLLVNNAAEAAAFYTAAFGAIEKKRFSMPGNKLSLVIEIDNAVFYVSDEEPVHGNESPVRIVLQTSHADEIFGKALLLGAIVICPIVTETDWRIGRLKDPFGHTWEIGYTL